MLTYADVCRLYDEADDDTRNADKDVNEMRQKLASLFA